MNPGIWKVGRARLCSACQLDMLPNYVMRCRGDLKKTPCERCGKEAMTMLWQYTMNKAGLTKIGRLDG